MGKKAGLTRGALLLGAAFILNAAEAGALYYLDERFEATTFPPSGWTELNQGGGDWSRSTWGSYYGIALGQANASTANTEKWADLESFPVALAANTTLYFGFAARTERSGVLNLVEQRFYIYNVVSSFVYADLTLAPGTSWHREEGMAALGSEAATVKARWHVHIRTGAPPGGGARFYIDNCQLCDEPMTAVVPASLSRVKAVFR